MERVEARWGQHTNNATLTSREFEYSLIGLRLTVCGRNVPVLHTCYVSTKITNYPLNGSKVTSLWSQPANLNVTHFTDVMKNWRWWSSDDDSEWCQMFRKKTVLVTRFDFNFTSPSIEKKQNAMEYKACDTIKYNGNPLLALILIKYIVFHTHTETFSNQNCQSNSQVTVKTGIQSSHKLMVMLCRPNILPQLNLFPGFCSPHTIHHTHHNAQLYLKQISHVSHTHIYYLSQTTDPAVR